MKRGKTIDFVNFYTEVKCHIKIHVHVANSTLELIVFIKYISAVLQNLFFLFNFTKHQQQ